MASVDDLIAAGLTSSGVPFDWAHAEFVLSARIPEDFRRLLDAGGAGLWFHKIRLYAPDARRFDMNLLDSVGVFEDLKILWDDEVSTPPDDLEPETRLLAWADTGCGETLFWRVDPGVDPSAYPIYVENADGDGWERLDLSVTDFLAGIMRGEVNCDCFGEMFMDVARTFQPYVT